LVDANGNYRSYDDVAFTYNLSADNENFIKYIKLMSAIPENRKLNSVFIDNKKETIGSVLKKMQIFKKSSKSCYNYLFSKLNSTPAKQQLRCN